MIATAAGLVFGIALAHGLLQVVNRTIVNEVYDLLTDSNLTLSNLSLLKGALLGMAGTLLAAIPAALEATRVTPRQALLRSHLEASSRRLVLRRLPSQAYCCAWFRFCGHRVVQLRYWNWVSAASSLLSWALPC